MLPEPKRGTISGRSVPMSVPMGFQRAPSALAHTWVRSVAHVPTMSEPVKTVMAEMAVFLGQSSRLKRSMRTGCHAPASPLSLFHSSGGALASRRRVPAYSAPPKGWMALIDQLLAFPNPPAATFSHASPSALRHSAPPRVVGCGAAPGAATRRVCSVPA